MADLVFCSNQHAYDPDKYSSCPNCSKSDSGSTYRPTIGRLTDDPPPTTKNNKTKPPNDGFTRVILPESENTGTKVFNPVVGWLVCVEGPGKGRYYPIHYGYNIIGRDPSMNINIADDDTISRKNHAELLYDHQAKEFTIQRREARSPVRVNEKRLSGDEMVLNSHDLIDFGETKLLFVPLCGENFKYWS